MCIKVQCLLHQIHWCLMGVCNYVNQFWVHLCWCGTRREKNNINEQRWGNTVVHLCNWCMHMHSLWPFLCLTHTHARRHACAGTCAHVHTHIHTHTHTHTHTSSSTCAKTHTHACTHRGTDTRMGKHTHTYSGTIGAFTNMHKYTLTHKANNVPLNLYGRGLHVPEERLKKFPVFGFVSLLYTLWALYTRDTHYVLQPRRTNDITTLFFYITS